MLAIRVLAPAGIVVSSFESFGPDMLAIRVLAHIATSIVPAINVGSYTLAIWVLEKIIKKSQVKYLRFFYYPLKVILFCLCID